MCQMYRNYIVSACCTLHNICEVHGDGFNDEWIDGTEQTQQDPSVTNSTAATTNSTGESIREVLMDYFVQHPLQEADV